MDNYGQTMKGPFIAQVIANVSALVYSASDAGRLVYDTATGKMFFGDNVSSAFRTMSDIPPNAVILFESDTQQVGYTLLTDQNDGVVYFTSGSGAGGEVGGADKSGGTWTQPGHSHTGPSHTHTGPSHTHNAPQHQHDLSNHYHVVAAHAHTISHTHTYSGNTSYELTVGANYATGGDNAHYHTYSGTTSDSSSGVSGNSSPATGGPSYNATGNANAVTTDAAGTGATGAAGTGATSSAATANTWRPNGRNYTRQRRN